MNFLSVDAIEVGSHAVCEDENGEEVTVDFCDLPKNVKEGDVICLDDEGRWQVNRTLTQQRRERIMNLRKSIYGSKKKI